MMMNGRSSTNDPLKSHELVLFSVSIVLLSLTQIYSLVETIAISTSDEYNPGLSSTINEVLLIFSILCILYTFSVFTYRVAKSRLW
jgi:hypothetical protein